MTSFPLTLVLSPQLRRGNTASPNIGGVVVAPLAVNAGPLGLLIVYWRSGNDKREVSKTGIVNCVLHAGRDVNDVMLAYDLTLAVHFHRALSIKNVVHRFLDFMGVQRHVSHRLVAGDAIVYQAPAPVSRSEERRV